MKKYLVVLILRYPEAGVGNLEKERFFFLVRGKGESNRAVLGGVFQRIDEEVLYDHAQELRIGIDRRNIRLK